MEVSLTAIDALTKVTLNGELDASTAIIIDNQFKELLEKGQTQLVIDCEDLQYISSAGVGVFISFIDDFKDKGGNFVFFNMQESVFNVFDMLGLDAILTIVPSEEEAKAAI